MRKLAGNIRGKKSAVSEFYAPKKKKSAFKGPLTFFISILAIIFVMSVLFRVSDIAVNGNSHYTDQEIINAIDIEEGDNLFFFDRFAAVSRVFAKLPYIEEVQIIRNLPNRVIIDVSETKAIAYIQLGNELWTLDHNCKVLGKANEDEKRSLVPIVGLDPDTLLINERLKTKGESTRSVDFLENILMQLQGRNMLADTTRIDFSDPDNVEFNYAGKYIIRLGDPYGIEYKFSMIVGAINQLKPGDIGIINVKDGKSVHFSPY